MERGDGEYRAKCSTSRVARPPAPPVVVTARGVALRRAMRAAFITALLFCEDEAAVNQEDTATTARAQLSRATLAPLGTV